MTVMDLRWLEVVRGDDGCDCDSDVVVDTTVTGLTAVVTVKV